MFYFPIIELRQVIVYHRVFSILLIIEHRVLELRCNVLYRNTRRLNVPKRNNQSDLFC